MSKKITDLPTLASAQVTDVLPIVDMTANVTKQVTTANVAAAVFASAPTEYNPHTRMSESLGNFVASGCVWTATSGLNASMTAGVVYINGFRVVVTAIASQAFTASKDTYVSVDNTGAVSIANSVANNATSPSLPANSVWLALVVTGASVSSVRQMGDDSNGINIYPTSRGPIQGWQAASFQNSWTNYDTVNWEGAAYMKDPMGFVHIKGMIKSGTMSTAAFTLPAGYRPGGKGMYFTTLSGGAVIGAVYVDSTGIVKPDAGNNTYQTLNGITFRAER